MTIKSQGGIFRRNPTFNNVEVDGTLTVGGNAVPDASTLLVDGDIGSTVQAYDADTAKLDVAQSYSETQNFSDVTLGTSVTPLGVMHFAANTNESPLPSIVLQDTGTAATRLGYLTNASGDIVLAATASITDQRARISLQDDRNITFSTANAERARINSNGLSFNGDTAAANFLDDYEEGTWTPAYSTSGGSFTYDTATQGQYTKIGNVVTVYFRIYTQSATVGSGNVTITGLPFAEAIPAGTGGGSIGDCREFAGDTPSEIGVNGSEIFLWYRTSVNGSNTLLQASDLGTGSVDNLIDGQITYITS